MSQRQDIFTVVHKAIRALLYDLGKALQAADFSEPSSRHVLDRLRLTLEMLAEHARHEERFIFAEIHRFEPGLVAALEAEHKSVEAKARRLSMAIDDLCAAVDDESRVLSSEALNRRFNEFVAAYFSHLNREEDEVLPATWKHLTDREIGEMRTRIQQDTAPERYTEWLRWIFSSQTTAELVKLFNGVRSSAPPEILSKMKQVAEDTVGTQRWKTIAERASL